MKKIVFTLIILGFYFGFSQSKPFTSYEITLNELIEGTLLVPNTEMQVPLVIIIQGSGPTDRNGNQPNVRNNSLKYLAEGLSNNEIATFRYDKRLVKLAQRGVLKEEDINFDDFVADAIMVLNHFKDDNRFSSITLAGHSQGSLVGMLASHSGAQAFISIAGAGQRIDNLIITQLERQTPFLAPLAKQAFEELRKRGRVDDFNPMLSSILRKSVQPFMFSWMQYDPQEELARLDIPVLILNGTEDLQTDVSEAQKLHKARPLSEFYIIENMNHILKEISSGDTIENAKSYNEAHRPIMPELIAHITTFINALEDK